ncbi:MAG TPA: VOC family protein [Acidimicrobiia bacterium]|nr:VOC family protein [Acidimicrobiia bacterium]
MTQASVRYIVYDVDEAVDFYREYLGFEVEMHPGPGFAMLAGDGLRLLLNMPGSGGGGQGNGDDPPQPGGWNRIQVTVSDIDETKARMERMNIAVRGDIREGQGGRQLVIEDPSGNPIELFEAAAS